MQASIVQVFIENELAQYEEQDFPTSPVVVARVPARLFSLLRGPFA